MLIPRYVRQLLQSVLSTVQLGRPLCTALVLLVCASSLSVVVSATSRGTTTGISGQMLSSRTNPFLNLPADPLEITVKMEDDTVNPSGQPTFSEFSMGTKRRHKHNHGKRRKTGNGLTADPTSNAADISTGTTIKVGSANEEREKSGVIASTPRKSSSRKSPSERDETEIISLCPNCGLTEDNSHTHQPLSREEMVKIRIEAVKQEILDKLRLSRPPQVNISKLHIPAPLLDSEGRIPDLAGQNSGEFSHHGDTIHGEYGREDYYGKTTKIIIQAEQDDTLCRSETAGGKCFTFRFSSSNTRDNVHSAQLWVYWNGSVFADHPTPPNPNLSITVQEILTKNHDPPRVISTNDFTGVRMTDWMKFDLKPSVRRWHRHTLVDHSINVICNDCDGLQASDITEALSPSAERGFTPFVVIHTTKSKRGSRVKRSSTDCSIVGDSSCCKENLYIRFSDIEFSSIIVPQGFQANFCRGVCHMSTQLHSETSGWASIFAERRRAMRSRGIAFETCCTPTKKSDLNVLYVDSGGRYNSVSIPDMKIDSCGCSF